MSTRLDKALEKACHVFKYLPYVLKRVDITDAAGKKSWMRWTPDGLISINIDPNQGDTDDKFELLLLHEVGHIIYSAHLFQDDPRWLENPRLVNVAQDLIINETIMDFDAT